MSGPDDQQPPAGPGRLTGVGVGPGDPGLLTRRAVEVLEAADRVVAPTTSPHEAGRAESVVLGAVPGLSVTRLPFDMTAEGPDAAGARRASHERAAAHLVPWLAAGEHVAFVTLGDPGIYSTFPALLAALRPMLPGVAVDTVPGITAFQALASRTSTVLLDGTESLSLVTALDGTGPLADALAEGPARTIVVYKGGRHLPAIAELLDQHHRLEGAVLGERLGLDGERILPLGDAADGPASYLATVIVPPGPPS